MMKAKYITSLSTIAAVLLLGASSASVAGESGMKDINSYTCKDIMGMSGDARDISIGYLHGYWMGKSGKTTFNKAKVEMATDSFIDFCLDNPGKKAVASMREVSK